MLLLVLLTGCAQDKSGGAPHWTSFPVPIYSTAAVTTSTDEARDLQDAMAFWENRAGKRLFDYRGTWTGGTPYSGSPSQPSAIYANVIFMPSPWPFGNGTAGQTSVLYTGSAIQGSLVMINGSTPMCDGDCVYGSYGYTSHRRVVTHELGHFLGLAHVNDTANIMNPTVMPGASLDNLTVDQSTLMSLVSGG